jgi:glutamyl-tRNA reductase
VEFEALLSAMGEADIVVSSTGCPQAILRREDVAAVMAARRNRPLFLIDIAVPRDIDADVQQLENVYLYNVDHLEAIVRENVRSRGQELARCREIIAQRAIALLEKITPREVETREALPAPQLPWAFGGLAASA